MTVKSFEDTNVPSILLSKHCTMTEVCVIVYIVHWQTVNILLREPQKDWLEILQSAMRGPRGTFWHARIPSERERGGVRFNLFDTAHHPNPYFPLSHARNARTPTFRYSRAG